MQPKVEPMLELRQAVDKNSQFKATNRIIKDQVIENMGDIQ